MQDFVLLGFQCRNPSLRLATKARACKGAGQEWSSGVTFHVLESVEKCEGMNPHTTKWIPTLRIVVPMDSQIFRRRLQTLKLIGFKSSLYHWKYFGTYMSKMGCHDPFGYLKHKLWSKKGSVIKLPIWLPTIKNQELPWFTCVEVACHILVERSWQGLQLCFRPHLNRRSSQEVMGLQNCGSPNFRNFQNFRTPNLRIPGQNDIWVQALWPSTKNTIKGKVVASPKSGSWWVLWIRVWPWLTLAPKVL